MNESSIPNPDTIHLPTEEVTARLEHIDERIRDLCREHPLAMLGGAAVIGFLLARIIAR